jgi:hypothetical protein
MSYDDVRVMLALVDNAIEAITPTVTSRQLYPDIALERIRSVLHRIRRLQATKDQD